VKWPSFNYGGVSYGLTHLHPQTFEFERPAEGKNAAERYTVDVTFTSHCFTRSPKQGEAYDLELVYPDPYELRLFDLRRYKLSKFLPHIIRGLPSRKTRLNGINSKFFTVDLVDEGGQLVEYDIFFKVRKAMRKGRIELILESAFVRDPDYNSTRPDGRPVRFWIILHCALNNKRIRP